MSKHDINHDKSNSQINDTYEKTAQNIDNENLHTLYELIIDESSKTNDEIDKSMIDECINLILEIKGLDPCSEDEKERMISNVMQNYDKRLYNSTKNKKSTFKLKLAVCMILGLLLIMQFTAMALGYNPIIEIYKFFKSNIGVIVLMKDEITYTYLDNVKTYESIDEIVEQENLNILYPLYLSDGIKATSVIMYDVDGYTQISIAFNTSDLQYMTTEDHFIDIGNTSVYEIKKVENIDVYVLYQEKNYEAIFYYETYEYHITCIDYELLFNVINNLNIK